MHRSAGILFQNILRLLIHFSYFYRVKIKFVNQLLIGLVLGVATGLLIGEHAAVFEIVGDAFIGLMQMTVLPYILVALIANLAKIELGKSRRLIAAAATMLFILLGIGILMIIVVPMFFPKFESASFFSSTLVEQAPTFDFIGTYIPSNIFASLSKNIVPAIVIFAMFIGLALNSVKNKQSLVRILDVLTAALSKANKFIIKLTPYGVFGIAANTAGTISFSQIGLLQVYLVAYTTVIIVLAFIFLPMLISSLTPFKFKEMLKIPKATLLAIFATSKIIILLPQMIEDIVQLFKNHGRENKEINSSAELLLPLAYPFPNLGTLVIMIFVPFAAWFVGRSFDTGELFLFTGTTLMSSFVAPVTGIPYLLDLFKLPNDTFQLFVLSSIWTDRIRVVLGAMHLYTITIVAIAFVQGMFKINVRKLVVTFAVGAGALLILNLPLKYFIGDSFQKAFDKYETFVHMDFDFKKAKTVTHSDFMQVPSDISVITDRGWIRVGYYRDALPFVYNNKEGTKIGFDAEIANKLAIDLNIGLEWVLVPRGKLPEYLNRGKIDMMICDIPILTDYLGKITYSEPYSHISAAVIVKDYKRSGFKTLLQIQKKKDVSLAILPSEHIWGKIRKILPDVKLVSINSPRQFFRDTTDRYDALLYSAEAGSAWTLVYPDFTVIVPEGLKIELPVSVALAKDNYELTQFVNQWLTLKKTDGTIEKAFDYWILGKGSEKMEKRWSILKDELHWID